MAIKETKKSRIVFSVIILLCVVLVLAYNAGAPPAPAQSDGSYRDKILDTGWAFTIDGKTQTRSLPVSSLDFSNTGMTFEKNIPAEREENSALCVSFYSVPFTVYFNGEPIYEYGIDAASKGYRSVGSGFHIIELPQGSGTVRIDVPPMEGTPGAVFSAAFLMPGAAFLKMFVQYRALTILVALILFSLFIYTLVARRTHSPESSKSTSALAMLSFCAALWLIARTGLLQFFTDNLIFINALDFLSFFLLPICALRFVQQRLRLNDRRLAVCLFVSTAYLIVASLLHILHIADFTQTLIVFHIILAIDIVCICLSVFRKNDKHIPHMNVLRTGVIILMAGAILELVSYYLFSFRFLRLSFLEITLLAFTLCMFYVWNSESRNIREQLSRQSVFRKMAYTDELTGLKNRAAFERDAQKLFYSESTPLYLFMIDLNELKKINDIQGHDAGDIFICNSAAALEQAVGKDGQLFRFGGDEFIVLLPGGDMDAALLYRRLQPYMRPNDGSLTPSFSVGYAAFDPSDEEGIRSVLRRADRRMYRFKSKMHGDTD